MSFFFGYLDYPIGPAYSYISTKDVIRSVSPSETPPETPSETPPETPPETPLAVKNPN